MNEKYRPIEHIIAKLDNDFNLDNSDWIPRIAAWTIEAMSQIKCLAKEKKCFKVAVINRIAKSPCNLEVKGLKIYDSRGCPIDELDDCKKKSSCCGRNGFRDDDEDDENDNDMASPSTGGRHRHHNHNGGFGGIGVANDYAEGRTPYDPIGIHVNHYPPHDTRVVNRFVENTSRTGKCRNYILVDCHTIELNFDDKFITIETDAVKTFYSDYFKAEVPVIPNNGLLIEAIGYYCLYKILCRGIKHPVFNLQASQYGTNAYYLWTVYRERARRSVINDEIDEALNKGKDSREWQSYFYNYTFPKHTGGC